MKRRRAASPEPPAPALANVAILNRRIPGGQKSAATVHVEALRAVGRRALCLGNVAEAAAVCAALLTRTPLREPKDLDHCVRFGVRLLEAAGEASRTAWYLRALTSVAEKIWPHHQTLWNPREGLALEIALRESGVGALDSAYELLGRKARQLLSNPLVSGYAALLALLIVRHELQQVPGGDAPRLSSEWRGSLGVRRISKKAADVLKEGVQFSARALELRPDSSFFVFIRAQLLFLAEGMGAAKTCLRAFADSNPTHPDAQQLAMFSNMHGVEDDCVLQSAPAVKAATAGAPCMSGPSCVHVEDADALVEFHATEVEKCPTDPDAWARLGGALHASRSISYDDSVWNERREWWPRAFFEVRSISVLVSCGDIQLLACRLAVALRLQLAAAFVQGAQDALQGLVETGDAEDAEHSAGIMESMQSLYSL